MNLTFYKTITPNTAAGMHYYFTDIDKYIAFISTYKVTSLSIQNQNFVLNNEITSTELLDYANPYEITYIKYTYTNADGTSFHQFYNVISCRVINQKVILSVELDLWGTYIASVKFSNLQVTRSNKDVGTGVLDPIIETQLAPRYDTVFNEEVKPLTMLVVGLYEHRVEEFLNKQYTNNLALFSIDFSELQTVRDKAGITTNLIDFAVQLASGAIQYSQFTPDGSFIFSKFNVIRAYFVEKEYIEISNKELILDSYVEDKRLQISSFFVLPSTKNKIFQINTSLDSENFIGTKLTNLKLPRTTKFIKNGSYQFVTKQDALEVKIVVGDKQLDITQAFEITLTNNDGTLNTAQQNNQILQGLTGVLAVGTAAASGTLTAAAGGLLAGAATLNNLANFNSNASYSKGGDGYNTFRGDNGEIVTPYYLVKYLSVDNELDELKATGANYSDTIKSFNEFLQADFIEGIGSESIPYIQAQIKVAEGAPQEAINLINQHLSGGIYVKEIT